MEYKVSVIVPMYNASRFIKAAVDGALNQSLKELEVIVIDDGSPDDSLEICRKLYGDNERVRILSQPKNMGPGAARNVGIKAARGEYIAFLDSDDGILNNGYEELYKTAKEMGDADVVHCTGFILPLDKEDLDNIYDVDEKYYFPISTDRYDVPKEAKALSDDFDVRYENWKKHAYHWNVVTKLFRTEFLRENDIRFGDIRLSEDMVFCFTSLFLAKNYVVVPRKYYLYRITNESLSRRGYTTQFFKTCCHALFNVCATAQRAMDKAEYFKSHPESAKGVLKYMLDILETEFVIPAYQSLGEEAILADGIFTDFMEEQFGENVDYVTYAFFEQHRKYPPTVSYTSQLNIDSLLVYKEKFEAAKREGKVLV